MADQQAIRSERLHDDVARSAGVILLMAALLLGVARPALADFWYEHYARAETALEAEDWSRAVQELEDALERKGDSGARVRSYGMKVIAYFPYLKLGIAYYHLGQLEAALQAFQTEEQLGAVQSSEADLAELERYRRLATDARRLATQREAERIAQIVRESLAEAGILERQGRLEAAMEALGKGLAVDPTNAEAAALMDRLRTGVVERQLARENDARASELIGRGRTLLQEKQYAEASSVLRQALSLRSDSEAQRLLDQAQEALRSAVQVDRDIEVQRVQIERGLAAARELEADGRFSDALDRLQPVLASDPENSEALNLQASILRAQQAAVRSESVGRALAEAEAELAAGRFEGAISAANRVLAQEPGNTSALEHVRTAYREISRRLLGSQTIQNIPPAIRFADLRQDRPDGSRVQLVHSRDFRLNGVIIDNSPVEVRFLGPADREVEGTGTSQPVGEYFITEFSLADRLVEGPSTYKLIATDSAGLSSSGEYIVVYAPPFYRSLWFIGLATTIPFGAVAAFLARRVRRRRQLISRRFNPYIAGAPVLDKDLFFGRDQLVEQILQTIHNNSLLLHGERRIGKTSLQHHLKKRLQRLEDPQYDFYPVFIDLQGTPEERFFATVAEDVFHELAPVLGGLASGDLADGSAYGYRELVRDLRNVIKTLEGRSPKQIKLVLLIDEVDELNEYDPRINQKLRSLFMKSFAENLVAVVSGVEIRKQWEKEGSPWYNFFEEIEVTALGRDDAETLIRRPIQGVFKLHEGVVDRIIELTERKPYAIQSFCIALVNRLHEQKRRTITVADVEAVGLAREP
jgi:tetratricopeptide (TPR) repeat protein